MPAPIPVHVGERYGALEVVGEPYTTLQGHTPCRVVLCRCDCGTAKVAPVPRLHRGGVTHCAKDCALLAPVQAGERFGSWLVLDVWMEQRTERYRARRVLVRCTCGEEHAVSAQVLLKGESQSCRRCSDRGRAARMGKHCLSGTGTYNSWKSMNRRCHGQGDPAWEYYGGRGVTVCELWRSPTYGGRVGAFERFLEDMGERPEATTLDRIDPEGDYSPGNCRWATLLEQRANRRSRRGPAIAG